MTESEKQEVLYVLESRLTRYIASAKEWFSTTGLKIKGTYTDRINGDLPLYFKSNSRKWQSLIPNISPFCFCFTKDLGISNMIDVNMRITDILDVLSKDNLVIQGMRIIAKSNTHLLGTSQQVLIMFPDDWSLEAYNKKVSIELPINDALALLDNETISPKIRLQISKQLQSMKNNKIAVK